MGSDEAQTEKLIKAKAKVLFFQKGFLSATTQQIADEAGVNRALIHYYFRSRELMLDILLEETIQEKKDRVRSILNSDLNFKEKIALYIHIVVDHGLKYPYLENFIINETARHPEKLKLICSKDRVKSSDLIRQQLEAEVKNKRLPAITAEHFMINLSALCNYPLLAKNILQTIHGMSDSDYRKFLVERKKVIFHALFSEEMPDVSLLTEPIKYQ